MPFPNARPSSEFTVSAAAHLVRRLDPGAVHRWYFGGVLTVDTYHRSGGGGAGDRLGSD